jgi:hypothetical protein
MMAEKIQVLYVDDETTLLDLSKIFLEQPGDMTVTTTTSTLEAIQILATKKFDTIVSDYQMPEMDGIEFLKYLKAKGDTTPVIIFTGRGREEVVMEALNAGADFYLQKGGDSKAQFAELSNKIRYAVSRRRALTAFRESEEKYRHIVDTAEEGIWTVDEHFIITYTNRRMAEMLGYRPDEILGRAVQSFMPESELADHAVHSRHQKEGVSEQFERQFLRRDGSILWVYVSVTPVRDANGTFKGSFAMYSDITERKRAAKALEASLREKELLLKEIHHRVKNNLQTISSLLYLQSLSTDDEQQVALLKDARSRVISMGLIHQKLYQSADIAHIPFIDYIRDLIDFLADSYGIDPEKVHTIVRVTPPDLTMELDTGIPCGLILNELITNAFKYAFRGREGGTITITMEQDPRQYALTVSDNGNGIPPDLDLSTTKSLGMTIVSDLVSQLEGELEIVRQPGATYRIQFPYEKT